MFDGAYTKDESFDTMGKWILGVNDSHGTHVLGTIAANRDGANHHGVAWNSTSYSANTGGSDDSNYGPFLDYGFSTTVGKLWLMRSSKITVRTEAAL